MRHTLKTLPDHQPPARTPSHDRRPRGARSTTGHHLRHPTTHPITTTHLTQPRGFFHRLCRRVARAPYLSREEQFRLLEVALRIKLASEGKPEDLITLRRPDDLPPPPGTPVRQPQRPPLYARQHTAKSLASSSAHKRSI